MTPPMEAARHPPNLLERLEVLRPLLERQPLGLLTDLDGTIAPIVSAPERAQVDSSCRRALEALRGRLKLVAVVTGRSVEVARQMVGLPDLVYVGNHGLEHWDGGTLRLPAEVLPYIPRMRELAEALRKHLALPGMLVEEKGPSIAVHFRLTEDPLAMKERVTRVLQDLGALEWARVLEGKMVVNVLPPVEVDKGTAVAALVQDYALEAVILLGDDVTDISAFQALHRLAAASKVEAACIVVEGANMPPELAREADFSLWSVGEVGSFLTWLAERLPSRA